jgi:hypothetical protein
MSKKRSAATEARDPLDPSAPDEGSTWAIGAEDIAELGRRDAAEEAEAEAEDALVLARLRREAKAREIAAEIQHGKTPSKKTAVTQVRILEDQLADLKQIAALTGQNIAGILREVLAEYILRMREDEYVRRSLDWAAGGREVMRRLRAEQAEKLAVDENSMKSRDKE